MLHAHRAGAHRYAGAAGLFGGRCRRQARPADAVVGPNESAGLGGPPRLSASLRPCSRGALDAALTDAFAPCEGTATTTGCSRLAAMHPICVVLPMFPVAPGQTSQPRVTRSRDVTKKAVGIDATVS